MSCFSHMLHCSPHHNTTINFFALNLLWGEKAVGRTNVLPEVTQLYLTAMLRLVPRAHGLQQAQMGKAHCLTCADCPASWLGGKCFWRTGKSHLSTEGLNPAPPQWYSLGVHLPTSQKKRYIFQAFPLKSDHNAHKGGEECKVTRNTRPAAHQKILKRYKGNPVWIAAN